MAKVWFCMEGPRPTIGGPAYELPLVECEKVLGLTAGGFLTDLSKPPKFNVNSKLGSIAGYKHVVIEVSESEAARGGYLPGFYHLHLDPDEVIERMGKPPRSPMAEGP